MAESMNRNVQNKKKNISSNNTSNLAINTDTPKLKDLNLSNNFLFGEVMWDEGTSKDVLEIILGKEIDKVVIVNKEQHMEIDKIHKGIRLDVYLKDEKETIYNIEIQVENKYNIPKRSRHYQGVIDTKILPAGEIDYNKLNDTYIIFICMFDLFGMGKYCYTFEERCQEVLDLTLGDGTRKIFLNIRGCNEQEIRQELVEFLKYVEHTDGTYLKTDKLKRLDQRVRSIKENAEVEARFMTMLLYEKEIAMDAREEGREEGTILTYLKLIEDGIMTIEQVTARLDVSEDEFYEMARVYSKNK